MRAILAGCPFLPSPIMGGSGTPQSQVLWAKIQHHLKYGLYACTTSPPSDVNILITKMSSESHSETVGLP